MSSDRSSSKPIVLVGLLLGVPTVFGIWYSLRPVISPESTPAVQPAPAAKKPEPVPAKNPDKHGPSASPSDPHEMHPLSAWDGPFAFDPLRYLPEATTQVHKKYDDAVLVGLRLGQVKPVGRINLKSRDAFAAYRFRSPSRSKAGEAVGAEPCLIDLVVTGEGVQVLTPKVAEVGCSSPALAVPECDLLRLWLLAIQERTPTEPAATYELVAPPGVAARADSAPALGQWKLTMASSSAPLERLYDASCQPLGREKAISPVDPERWRAENAAAAARPAPEGRPPIVEIRPVGDAPAALQQALVGRQPAVADCFRAARTSCGNCAKSFEAALSLSVEADGKVSSAEVAAVPMPEKGEKPQAAAAQFGQCVQKAVLASAFPAGAAAKAGFQMTVAARRSHDGE